MEQKGWLADRLCNYSTDLALRQERGKECKVKIIAAYAYVEGIQCMCVCMRVCVWYDSSWVWLMRWKRRLRSHASIITSHLSASALKHNGDRRAPAHSDTCTHTAGRTSPQCNRLRASYFKRVTLHSNGDWRPPTPPLSDIGQLCTHTHTPTHTHTHSLSGLAHTSCL